MTTPKDQEGLNCDGFRKLLAAVEKDERDAPGFHRYREKLAWVLSRARHYAEKTGLTAESILDAWESRRNYWYMNYYQDANQPEITGGTVRVFETVKDMLASIGKPEFRCPACSGVSTSPYECDSGVETHVKKCDWKVYGLFGHMGKGVSVYVKEKLAGENLFMPIAWEPTTQTADKLGIIYLTNPQRTDAQDD